MKRALFVLTALTLGGCSETGISSIENALGGDGPAIKVTPSSLQYDLWSEGDDPQTKTFVIQSVGNEDLTLEGIELTGQASASYTIVTDLTFPLLLEKGVGGEGGDTQEVEVVFEPFGAGELNAQAIISSDAENSPKLPVSLAGAGAIPELRISPDPLDFGRAYVGCYKDNQVTLSNVGTDDLTISNISLEGDEFEADIDGIAMPIFLEPGDEFNLPMSFWPDLEGRTDGVLSVTSDEPMGIRTAAQFGEGIYAATYEDRWDSPESSASDIIFAVDRSCSMSDDNAKLANNFSTFISQLSNYSSDWHIMVINDSNGCTTTGTLTPSTPSYTSIFQNAINSGSKGWYTEALLTPAASAVDQTDIGECNAGFMRPDALLHIVLVSDEPEQSSGSWSTYVNQIIAKKGDIDNVRISSIVGNVPGGCSSASAGTGYVDATNYTDGLFLSICSDWANSTNLELLAEASVIKDTYELSNDAIEETITVTIEGVDVPAGTDWTFNPKTNSVVFSSNPPEEGETITVNYASPASCD